MLFYSEGYTGQDDFLIELIDANDLAELNLFIATEINPNIPTGMGQIPDILNVEYAKFV